MATRQEMQRYAEEIKRSKFLQEHISNRVIRANNGTLQPFNMCKTQIVVLVEGKDINVYKDYMESLQEKYKDKIYGVYFGEWSGNNPSTITINFK